MERAARAQLGVVPQPPPQQGGGAQLERLHVEQVGGRAAHRLVVLLGAW